MTEQLQEAYSKAGDEMAKQMAAAVVARSSVLLFEIA
jgi:hypothetical protein